MPKMLKRVKSSPSKTSPFRIRVDFIVKELTGTTPDVSHGCVKWKLAVSCLRWNIIFLLFFVFLKLERPLVVRLGRPSS